MAQNSALSKTEILNREWFMVQGDSLHPVRSSKKLENGIAITAKTRTGQSVYKIKLKGKTYVSRAYAPSSQPSNTSSNTPAVPDPNTTQSRPGSADASSINNNNNNPTPPTNNNPPNTRRRRPSRSHQAPSTRPVSSNTGVPANTGAPAIQTNNLRPPNSGSTNNLRPPNRDSTNILRPPNRDSTNDLRPPNRGPTHNSTRARRDSNAGPRINSLNNGTTNNSQAAATLTTPDNPRQSNQQVPGNQQSFSSREPSSTNNNILPSGPHAQSLAAINSNNNPNNNAPIFPPFPIPSIQADNELDMEAGPTIPNQNNITNTSNNGNNSNADNPNTNNNGNNNGPNTHQHANNPNTSNHGDTSNNGQAPNTSNTHNAQNNGVLPNQTQNAPAVDNTQHHPHNSGNNINPNQQFHSNGGLHPFSNRGTNIPSNYSNSQNYFSSSFPTSSTSNSNYIQSGQNNTNSSSNHTTHPNSAHPSNNIPSYGHGALQPNPHARPSNNPIHYHPYARPSNITSAPQQYNNLDSIIDLLQNKADDENNNNITLGKRLGSFELAKYLCSASPFSRFLREDFKQYREKGVKSYSTNSIVRSSMGLMYKSKFYATFLLTTFLANQAMNASSGPIDLPTYTNISLQCLSSLRIYPAAVITKAVYALADAPPKFNDLPVAFTQKLSLEEKFMNNSSNIRSNYSRASYRNKSQYRSNHNNNNNNYNNYNQNKSNHNNHNQNKYYGRKDYYKNPKDQSHYKKK